MAAILVIAAISFSACTSIPEDVSALDNDAFIAELESTPFYPQKEFQCGPAALTTVLQSSGVNVPLNTISRLTFIPDKQGSLQTELLSAARRYERIPYPIGGTMSELASELRERRPVLVLQNLGVSWFPRWHYAVVVGIDADHVILRSGTDRRRVTKKSTFLRTWQRGDYWAVVLLQPDELPANPQKARLFKAIADVEETGQYGAAFSAWNTALSQWPADPVALFGKASAAFLLKDYAEAERTYQRLLTIDSQMHAARNNLAYVLAAQGKLQQALTEMRAVLDSVSPDDPLRSEYVASLKDLEGRAKP